MDRFFTLLMLCLLFCSCQENKPVSYSISKVQLKVYMQDRFPAYKSKFICSNFIEFEKDSIKIYENLPFKNKRFTCNKSILKDKKSKLIEIAKLILSQKSRSCFMDSTIYCGLPRKYDVVYVVSKKTDQGLEINYDNGNLPVEEVLYLDSLFSALPNDCQLMSNSEFLPAVLRDEQYANLNVWTPPPPPPYKGKVKFTPPSNSK